MRGEKQPPNNLHNHSQVVCHLEIRFHKNLDLGAGIVKSRAGILNYGVGTTDTRITGAGILKI